MHGSLGAAAASRPTPFVVLPKYRTGQIVLVHDCAVLVAKDRVCAAARIYSDVVPRSSCSGAQVCTARPKVFQHLLYGARLTVYGPYIPDLAK